MRMMICLRTWFIWSQDIISSIWLWCTTDNNRLEICWTCS